MYNINQLRRWIKVKAIWQYGSMLGWKNVFFHSMCIFTYILCLFIRPLWRFDKVSQQRHSILHKLFSCLFIFAVIQRKIKPQTFNILQKNRASSVRGFLKSAVILTATTWTTYIVVDIWTIYLQHLKNTELDMSYNIYFPFGINALFFELDSNWTEWWGISCCADVRVSLASNMSPLSKWGHAILRFGHVYCWDFIV